MKQKTLCMLILLIISVLTLSAQKISFEEFDLDNGLHVILHQDNNNPIVVVSVLYHVGSKNENPDRTGFAHFFEHLMFEGSKNIKRGEFDKYVSSRGGLNNAYTTKDITYYYELFPSNELALGLWLESERMLHARVDNKGIEVQREVVKEEKRLRYDNAPYTKGFMKDVPATLFKNHPYRWTTIGSMKHLNEASEEDYKNFYKKFYIPNNATLTIAGDIDMVETKKLVKDYFSDIPKGENITRPSATEAPVMQEIVDTSYDKNVTIPAVFFGYRTPKLSDNDTYVLNIISDVLATGESSRFTKSIVNDKQLALQAGAFAWSLEDYGIFIGYGLVNQGVEVETLVEAMDEEIEKLKSDGISQRELDKLINQLERSFIDESSTMAGIAQKLSNAYVFHGNTNFVNTELDIYRKITLDDVKRVANKYLNKHQRVRMNVVKK